MDKYNIVFLIILSILFITNTIAYIVLFRKILAFFSVSCSFDLLLLEKITRAKLQVMETKELACENSKEIGEHDRALLDIQEELKRG